MKLKNYQVVTLVNSGVLQTTNHSVKVEDAYKVFKFRTALRDAIKNVADREKALLEQEKLEADFEVKRRELKRIDCPSEEQITEIEALDAKAERFYGMRETLFNEEVDLGNILPVSYESWFALQNENREVNIGNNIIVDVFTGPVEYMLEGIFWNAPEE